MGPPATWVGSQSRLPPESRYGAEPSGGCWLAEPGQRRSMPVCRPASRCDDGQRDELRPGRRAARASWKALKIGWMRA